MYQVFDNGRPAQYPQCNVDPSWNNSKFSSYEAALSYAYRWLGITDIQFPLEEGIDLKERPYNYSGFGDTLEIREVG